MRPDHPGFSGGVAAGAVAQRQQSGRYRSAGDGGHLCDDMTGADLRECFADRGQVFLVEQAAPLCRAPDYAGWRGLVQVVAGAGRKFSA